MLCIIVIIHLSACFEQLGKNSHITMGRLMEDKREELFPDPDGVEYTRFLPADENVLE
jgi:hypothetical protein